MVSGSRETVWLQPPEEGAVVNAAILRDHGPSVRRLDWMGATLDFAVDLMLGGFASSVALVLFAEAPLRRVLMGFGLACAAGILAVSLVGPVRTGILLVILCFFRGHFRERRAGRSGPAAPETTGIRPRDSSRHRPGCSDR
jgi:hypothetical protein